MRLAHLTLISALLVAPAVQAEEPTSCEQALAASEQALADARARIAELEGAEAAPAVAQTEGYGATRWGMTQDEVRKAVPGVWDIDGGNLAIQDKVGGFDAVVAYVFAEGKLTMVGVALAADHMNQNDYLTDFETVSKLLTKKYGEPQSNEPIWKQTLYKDHTEHWGLAVSMGHLILKSLWTTPETEIMHLLQGDNLKVTHFVRYRSLALAEAAAKADEASRSKGL